MRSRLRPLANFSARRGTKDAFRLTIYARRKHTDTLGAQERAQDAS